MGDASTEQRQNNWWSACVAKQLHMKWKPKGDAMKKDGWGDGEDVVKEQVKKQKNQVQRGGGATGRERAVPHWGNLEG